ncbi:MAG: hypothetical protein KKD01_19530 [Proteobacteria bacterium]|nr:hypothetical protein [Pseudomonadota bacterium]
MKSEKYAGYIITFFKHKAIDKNTFEKKEIVVARTNGEEIGYGRTKVDAFIDAKYNIQKRGYDLKQKSGYKMYRWDDGKLRKRKPNVPEPSNYLI